MSKKFIVCMVLLGVVLLGELGYIWMSHTGGWTLSQKINSFATRILVQCQKSEYRPTCYDREIPKLMSKFSMEDVFRVTKKIQSQDSSYAYCHVLGHAVSAAETKKDPSKWRDIITRCPSGVCSNGCVHGAFQERFRTDVLTEAQIAEAKPLLFDVCEPRGQWNPTGMEQATCYHALGHLLMYITGANINRSTDLCDELAGQKTGSTYDFHQVCYDGVYMQVFQPLEPEDIALVKDIAPSKDTVNAFCDVYDGERRGSCISESWPLFFEEIQKPAFAISFCGRLTQELADRCYNSLFYILVVQFRFDLDQMKYFCDGLEGGLVGRCYANTASRLIETDWDNIDKAVEWCKAAVMEQARDQCMKELVSYASYNFHAGTKEFESLCQKLPTPWHDSCLQGEKEGESRPVTQ